MLFRSLRVSSEKKVSRRLYERMERIATAVQHRPFHPETPEHRVFAKAQLAAVEQLSKEYPELDFSAEMTHFQAFM